MRGPERVFGATRDLRCVLRVVRRRSPFALVPFDELPDDLVERELLERELLERELPELLERELLDLVLRDRLEPPRLLFVSPAWRRCLLTVAAAISFARSLPLPLSRALCLMCSY